MRHVILERPPCGRARASRVPRSVGNIKSHFLIKLDGPLKRLSRLAAKPNDDIRPDGELRNLCSESVNHIEKLLGSISSIHATKHVIVPCLYREMNKVEVCGKRHRVDHLISHVKRMRRREVQTRDPFDLIHLPQKPSEVILVRIVCRKMFWIRRLVTVHGLTKKRHLDTTMQGKILNLVEDIPQ